MTEWYCLKNWDMSTIRSRITGNPGSGRSSTGSLSSVSRVMQARPFLPLMFIASEPHTPSRQERRSDKRVVLRLDADQRVEQHAVRRLQLEVVVLHVGLASLSGS